MATKKKEKVTVTQNQKEDMVIDDFASELISQINKTHNEKIAFNLGMDDDAPTNVKQWVSTGSKQLDFIIANQPNGGWPSGRVIEIQGPASSGKSHLMFETAKNTQKAGGIVVYIDTENATNLQNLVELGVDVKKRFVFVQTACTEDIFQVIEETIIKTRSMVKDVPVTIIWDSVAASSPKAELEGAYDKDTIGLQARSLGRGLRKIVNIIGNHNVLLLLVNQQRQKIGVFYGENITTPGGMSIPYASSVRVKIQSTGQKQIQDKNGNAVGIQVKAKTIKNKVARPFRECEFQIHFGVGVKEHEEVFDLFRGYCASLPKGQLGVPCGDKLVSVEGTGAWKTFTVLDAETGEVLIEEKCHKAEFGDKVLYRPEYKEYMDALYTAALTMTAEDKEHPTYTGINSNSVEEVTANQE